MVPILADVCYLVVNLVSYCGKHNPLNADTTCSVRWHKIIVFHFIGPAKVVQLIKLNSLQDATKDPWCNILTIYTSNNFSVVVFQQWIIRLWYMATRQSWKVTRQSWKVTRQSWKVTSILAYLICMAMTAVFPVLKVLMNININLILVSSWINSVDIFLWLGECIIQI